MLRDAGVVDAGAAGLLEVLRGIASHVTGEPLPEAPEEERAGIESAHQELSQFRYCTGFVIEGEGLDADALERELAALGDSLLVVGDETALKVHVHTDDPGRALQLATAMGVVEAVEVANMHRQTAEREVRLLDVDAGETAATAVVAVSVGDGNRLLFEPSGATVVDGGETMNPSTEALLRAIESAPAAEVVVLPNNPNVFMAAEEAAALATKPAHVVRSGSIQAGLAAIVAHDATRSGDEDAAEMAEVLEGVAVGAVTVASRAGRGRCRGRRLPRTGRARAGRRRQGARRGGRAGRGGAAGRAAGRADRADRRGRARARRPARRRSRAAGPSWRSMSTPAASRTTACCSRPSRKRAPAA